MSGTFWRASLKKALNPPVATEAEYRLAVLGIGNELWGDDAAGSQVARLVQRRLSLKNTERCLIVDAGPVPENYSGSLRKFRPDFVLLVDAVRAGGSPGSIRWIDLADLEGVSAVTHGLPLTILCQFLADELDTTCGLLGIEGVQFELGAGLSMVVRRSVSRAAGEICRLIQVMN